MKDLFKKQLLEKDPLHEIIERHLYRSTLDEEASTQAMEAAVQDYILYLQSHGAHIPNHLRQMFVDDIREEVRELFIKKSFGRITQDQMVGPRKPLKTA